MRLQYRSAEDCPPREAFVDQVRWRLATKNRVSADRDPQFDVKIVKEGQEYRGELQVVVGKDAVANKQVRAKSCEEVVEALALVAALTIDPEAQTAPAPVSLGPAPSAAPESLLGPVLPLPVLPAPQPQPQPEPNAVWMLGLQGAIRSAVAPGWMGGAGGFVDLSGRKPWAPSARLSLSGAGTGYRTVGPGEGRFRFFSALIEGCPVQIRLTHSLVLTPCLGWDTGFVQGEGTAVRTPASSTGVWLAAQAAARLSLRLGSRLSAQLTAGAFVPVYAPTFVFDGPRTVAHDSQTAGALISLGVGYRLTDPSD